MILVKRYLNIFFPTLLAGLLPVIFYYNHNATKLNLQSIALPLLVMVVISMVTSVLVLLFYRSAPREAAVASIIYLIFFYVYGVVYDLLLKVDKIQVEHITFIPIYIFIAYITVKIALRVTRIIKANYLVGLDIILAGLIIFNIIGIVPVEARKQESAQINQPVNTVTITNNAKATYPDIYYIVLDESAAFNVIRTYWKYAQVDEFVNFLKDKGFFVAEDSHSQSSSTLVEIASRLNLRDMSGTKGFGSQDWYDAIADNEVMQTLKGFGYTTIVLDQVQAANGYINKSPIKADYDFKADQVYSHMWAFDDFFSMVFSRTLLRPLTDKLSQSDPSIIQHHNDVLYFFDKIAHLTDIPSPKFVYGQVLLTHVPLIFDQNGGMLDQKNYYNWNYYLDSYKFEITKVTELINSLLAQSDPDNPPIIIIQSDHGFRNIDSGHAGSEILANYAIENKYKIINALLLPNYDTSQLPNDLNPVDTFIIILDHYFNQNIPLQ
jgi:hypothetical protein